ncbi:MAG: peptidase M19 [SAR202 cluster bacterium]|nr:peptidase M19 [SAR202 cluster bacterium]
MLRKDWNGSASCTIVANPTSPRRRRPTVVRARTRYRGGSGMSKAAGNRKLYDDTIVIDGLNVSNWDSPNVYDSLHNGGVTAINATVAVWDGFRETLDNITDWVHRFEERGDRLLQVGAVADIHKAKAEGKTGVILGWQNAAPIENRLDRLALFHALGVRVIQLTYNERNLLGNGCYERTDDGLSNFGQDAVREMNRLGILIDLSHVGDRTTLEAIDLSEKPVAITHANARSFFEHVRNKTDGALKLLVEKNGVIGANAFPPFLRTGFESTLSDYVDAIDDLVERAGIDHVAIGTDYTQDQPASFFNWLFAQQGTKYQERPVAYPDPLLHPAGMETPDRFFNIATVLIERGYRDEDVVKVLGGNWLRLFGEVWGE